MDISFMHCKKDCGDSAQLFCTLSSLTLRGIYVSPRTSVGFAPSFSGIGIEKTLKRESRVSHMPKRHSWISKRRIYAAKFSQRDAENPYEKHRKSYDNTTKIDNDAGNLAT